MQVTWTEIKAFKIARGISIQYVTLDGKYYLQVFDGLFNLSASILITSPRNTDQIDFEDNYLAGSNTSPVNLPISAVTFPLPTGAATSTLQTTGNTSLSNIDTKTPTLVGGRQPVDGSGVTQPVSGAFFQATQPVSIAATVAVSGPLTDAQLRATPVPISGTITATIGANQSVNVAQVNGTTTATGAGTTTAGVQRVVLPTDQSAIPITATPGSFGALDYGAVTTNPPTYTTGTNQPLSITTAGELRVHENGVSSEVDLNRFYSAGVSVNQPSSGSDNPLLLIRNPAASGKVIRLWKVNAGVGVTNVFSIFRTWANPTVTANGTAATAVSRNIGGGAPAAVGLVNTTPTITSNGSQISSLVTGQNNNSVIFADDFSIAIRAGNSLLITGNPASNNRVSELTIIWTEE